jgi:serine/threonine-protein kinase HipA
VATFLWGKVYCHTHFAGILQEEPGDRASFTYDEAYLNAQHPAIAHTLPLQAEPHVSTNGLHPFFDNLVAEGWLEQIQTRLLGKRIASRFELLLAFGFDCAGSVSIADPKPSPLTQLEPINEDPKAMATFTSRASLSGVQPKLALIERAGQYFPAKINELSTHIAKFPSAIHADLTANEYLTMQAFKALLPDDDIAEVSMGDVVGISEPALIIKRFDRKDGKRLHFEEFNQLLGKISNKKYEGSHKEMSDFIQQTPGCLPAENYRLYARIITGLLLGNTDMHFKNFAMFHTPVGLRLTPSYDQVAAVLYSYKTLALTLAGAKDLPINTLKAKNILALGQEFGLPCAAVNQLIKQLAHNKEAAKETIFSNSIGDTTLKDQLIKWMEARWNGTFSLIGQSLSKKQ